ncbi:uncharacterized protein LOC119683393 [Teleopsis dalmanni]|uniref:uncharacterized protein LOC119683393 n=1 Tax=Teleopsis dalmanni TaxID=139649 RepID=UPI0018CE3EE3|nr:uncharacterized protein LOC119683393 [Teleopsis dalmanni]
MEDSGIDSEEPHPVQIFEDKQKVSTFAKNFEVPASHMDELEVVFRGKNVEANKDVENSNPTTDVQEHTAGEDSEDGGLIRRQPPNTCRVLQRKLELKVERAKRNYSQYQEEKVKKSQTATLIPISRLPIPGDIEQQKLLVDYKSDSNDEPEEISFFPAKLKKSKKHSNPELTDTFSIQEMTITSDLDSDDSQNLELLPPMMKKTFLDRIKSCFGCVYVS